MKKPLFCVLALAGLCLAPFEAFSAPVKAGFAERDVTPEIGMERPGGYGKVRHTVLHDPCKVRAAVFDDGEKTVALVGLDSLIIRRPQVLEARERIHEKTGIAPEAILLGASHSHSSGPVGMVLPGEFDHADALVQDLAYEQSSNADPEYLKTFVTAIVDAVTEAYESRVDAEIGFGSGIEETVSFNRRWKMKNGMTFTHPRQGNPDMVTEAGPIDPEVGVIGVWDLEGKLIGCVVNFACHATASPPGISANYIWFLEKTIQGVMGEDVKVCFLNGASGDVTQVDNASPYKRIGGEPDAMKVGGRVGAEAVKVLLDLPKTREVPVDVRDAVLKIERRKPSPAHLAAARKMVEEFPKGALTKDPDWVWAKETVMLDALIQSTPVRDVEIQAVQVGPAVFVTTPAEYFCQFGLDQKEAIPFPFTWPVSLANGCVGYVPTEEALGPGGGGYETRLSSYSNLIPKAGTLMRDKGIELAKELTPGPVPEYEPAPPFTAPWSYGNVPPQVD